MPDRIRPYLLPVAVAIAIVVCLYAFSPNFHYDSGPSASPYAGDYLQEWLGGWIVRAGNHDRFYDPEYAYQLQHDPSLVGFAWNEDEYLPIVYPPFYYAAICPFSFVPFHTSAWLWAGLMIGALAASVVLLQRFVQRPSKVAVLAGWLIPVAVFFQPVLESLSSSQKGTVCLLIFTVTFAFWRQGRAFTSGATFGLIAFKPQLALVIVAVALWQRQWRFVAGVAATGLALVGISLCLGVDVCWQYVQFALGTSDYMQTSGYDLHKSHSIWGFAQLLMPHADASLRRCFSLLMAALVVYQLVRVFSRGVEWDDARWPMQFSALTIATLLLSPHLFTYDLTLLLLPMTLLLVQTFRSTTQQQPMRWLLAILFIAPAISTSLAAATGVQATVLVMLALLSVIARTAEQRQSSSAIEANSHKPA